MQNVSGFGTESKYYKEIGLCAYGILKDVPELIKTVSKAKFSNKLLCLNELGNLVTETQQLVGNFVNIVNNATVQNPLKGQGTATTCLTVMNGCRLPILFIPVSWKSVIRWKV